MLRALCRDAESILLRSYFVSLSVSACALIVSALKRCISGFDTFFLSFGRVITVMLFDRAVTQGCRIKRHFVFFSSLIVSAKTSLSKGEREGEEQQEKYSEDDRASYRQVQQPAAVESAISIWDAAHQHIRFPPLFH